MTPRKGSLNCCRATCYWEYNFSNFSSEWFGVQQTAGLIRFIFDSAEWLENEIYVIKHFIVSAFLSLKPNFRVSYFVFSIFVKNEK